MPKPVNQVIQDKLIGHQIGLLRLSSGITNKLVSLLNQTEDDILNQLQRLNDERLNVVLNDIRAILVAAKPGEYELLKDELTKLSSYEAGYVEQVVKGALPIKFNMTMPSTNMLASIVTSRPFQGKLLKEWVEDLSENKRKRIRDAVRMGMVEGESIDKMARRIRGTRAAKYKDGLMEIDRRGAQAMVRTAVNETATRAREMVYIENDDLFSKVQWVATLDKRTCLLGSEKILMADGTKKRIDSIKIGEKVLSGCLQSRVVCGVNKKISSDVIKVILSNGKSVLCTKDHLWLTSNDGWIDAELLKNKKLMELSINNGTHLSAIDIQNVEGSFEVFDISVDVDESFIVEGCILHNCPLCQPLDGKTFPIDKGPRPPQHIACRCCTAPVVKSFRELGFDVDEAPETTRASMDGQVPEKITYNEWLKNQSKTVQDDILGPRRGEIFRNGASVDNFVDTKTGKKFTLKELEKMDLQ